jgi:uncharacterized membrane protein
MSPSTVLWVNALHIVGVILWVASLTSVLALLSVHGKVDGVARDTLTRAERSMALLMDLGATIAIGFGLYRALGGPPPSPFKDGPWLHIKLTVVVLGVLSVHGLVRAKIKAFREGRVRPLPPVVWIVFLAAVTAAAILGANKMLLRG